MAKLLMKERSAAPSLCMSMKISPMPAVVIFAGAQINLVPADHGLLRIALAAIRHFFALAHHHDALDQALHHFLRKLRGARGHRLVHEGLDGVVFLVVVADQLRVQRLRQL